MSDYQACFFVSNTSDLQSLIGFIENSGLGIHARILDKFSQHEAALAHFIFVGEGMAKRYCKELFKLKSADVFLPVLLVASKNTIPENDIPACVDDIILKPFLPTVWKKRLETFLRIIEKEHKNSLTGKTKAEQQAVVKFEKYLKIFENAPDIVILIDKKGIVHYVNQRIRDYGNYVPEDIVGKSVTNFISPEDYQEAAEAVIRVFEDRQKAPYFSSFLLLNDGRKIPIITKGALIKFGGVELNMTFVRDISSIKEAETHLKQSNETFEHIFNNNSVAIYVQEPTGKFLDINRAALRQYGYTDKNELIGKTPEDVAADGKNDFKQIKEYLRKAFNGQPQQFEFWAKRSDGYVFPKLVVVEKGTYFGRSVVFNFSFDLAAQKKMQEELEENEAIFNSVFNSTPSPVHLVNNNFEVVMANEAILHLKGYDLEDVVGKKCYEVFQNRNQICDKCAVKQVFENSQPASTRGELTLPDGQKRYFNTQAYPIYDHQKNIRFVVESTVDITHEKEAEEQLKASEAKYFHLFQYMKNCVAVYEVSEDGDIFIKDFNRAAEKLEKVKKEEIVGKKLEDVFPGVHDFGIYQAIIDVYNSGNPISIPVKIYKDKKMFGWRENYLYKLPTGEVVAIYDDVTKQKVAEESLKESENKYRSLAETSSDLILTFDINGKLNYLSPVVEKITGYSAEEVLRKNFWEFIAPEFVETTIENFKKGVAGEDIPLYEIELIHKSGRRIPMELNVTSLFDANGNVIGRLAVARDITDRKAAEKDLLLRDKALNATASAIVITDMDGIFEWVNEAFTKLSGYSKEEAVGKRAGELIDSGKQDKSFYEEMDKTLRSGQVWRGELIDKRKDGTLYEIEEIITPVTGQNGKVEHLIGIMTDIAERKAAERELRAAKEAAEESSRLKSAFLANMNHEIRTPMNAIMGFSELMLDAMPEEKENYAAIVNHSAGQLLNLIDDVIFLSRLQSEKLPVNTVTFYPAGLLREIFLMFDLPEMKKNLKLKMQVPENAESIAIFGDADKIRQVLTNLTSNALKYTEKGSVQLGFEIFDKSILFYVQDTGIGIPEEEQEHIFEALYRGSMAERAAIRGTGLGLNIAKGLVELMGGAIGVSSAPEKGSRFYFTLPYEPSPANIKQKKSYRPEARKWEELNILIVEDDSSNYLYLDVLLNEKVNRIDRALNGQEAVEMVRKDTYDIVLMDLKMPVMSGYEATREIKKLFPRLPVIATTAYATPEEKESALDAGCDSYITKPIKKEDIMKIIDQYVSDKS